MISRLLGLRQDGSISYFDWYLRHPWPALVLLGLILAAVLYAFYLYRKEATLTLWRRISLATLRSVLYAIIIVALFEPMLAVEMEVKIRRNLLVLVDTSQSMAIQDVRKSQNDIEQAAQALGKAPYNQAVVSLSESDRQAAATVDRLSLAKAILTNQQLDLLKKLSKDYKLRFFTFGDKLKPLPSEDESLPPGLQTATASAGETRLGSAIEEAVRSSQSIAGVIALTDGASNGGADPLDVATRLKEQNVPVYPVGLGLADSPDVRVKGLVVQDTVFVKDSVPVRAQVSAIGYTNQTAELTLSVDGKVVDRKTVTLNKDPQYYELYFTPEKKAAASKIEMAIAPLPNEVNTENNSVSRAVRVIDDKIKVLYVEGKPRWEYRYLRRVLMRDHRLEVKFLMTEGDKDLAKYSDEYIAEFPQEKDKAFQFDLVILGDVPARYFTPAQMARMEELVKDRGGSLLMLAGSRFAPTSYTGTPIADMLPVKFKNESWETVDDATYPLITPEGFRSSIMALEPTDAATQEKWTVVKPIYQVPPLDGAKPGATILAKLSDSIHSRQNYPLIAWHRYRSGKVLFVGTDQLWRLRYKVGDQYHSRFWGQTIQFLTLSRLLGQNKRIYMEIDKPDYLVGEQVQINSNVLTEAYDPAIAETYTVQIQRTDGAETSEPISLKAAKSVPGLYQGFFKPDKPGHYRLSVLQADQADANVVEFDVKTSTLELLEPAMQVDALRKLADLSGGKYFSLANLPELSETFDTRQNTMTVRDEKELWNLPVVLGALLLLMGLEWFFRRKFDLL